VKVSIVVATLFYNQKLCSFVLVSLIVVTVCADCSKMADVLACQESLNVEYFYGLIFYSLQAVFTADPNAVQLPLSGSNVWRDRVMG